MKGYESDFLYVLERIAHAQEEGIRINRRILELQEATHEILKANSASNNTLNKLLQEIKE